MIDKMGIFRRLFTGLGFLTFLLVLLVTGWIFREDIETWLADVGGDDIAMSEPNPEAATWVEAALNELAAGGGSVETRFTETELQSYVQYRLAPQLPTGVEEPAIELRDSTVAFSAKVDFTRLTVGGDAAASLGRMLGDSARVAGEVFPEVGEVGEGRIHLISLQAGVLPVPPLLFGMAAQQLGLRTDGRTVLFDIPSTVAEVRVENEEIILLMHR
ncbi:hypothetical protein [Candidatus Palauibacter sp.]|uniref:hypothetical protein n=1 Tax=Candidatus Palauibacter sp. TaxID=3101350 RepID=UPI003B59ACDD